MATHKKKGKTMEKFMKILKMKIEDETAAFTILGAMILTFAILIGTFEYIGATRTADVSSEVAVSQAQQEDKSTADNINNIENMNSLESVVDEEEAKKENEEEYEKLKKENKISSAADKYYIKVNYGAQVVTIYQKDSNGKYTVPVKAMVCSTGTYTPSSGVYRTLAKGNWWPLYGDVYGQYSTHICGGILFHSVPYLKSGDKSSLEYWAYDQLGQRVSMGCVRLTVEDAMWIYYNCPVGTQVEFYSSSNPGPLGKPTARKISSAPSNVRGWDPTDPDSRNPWPKYLKQLEEEKNNDKDNNKDDNKKPTDQNPNKNETSNEVANETVNEIVNETVNDVVNEISNEVSNDTNMVNDTNTTENKEVNAIDDNVYVSEIATSM